MKFHSRPTREPREFHKILTVSPQMEELFEQLEKAARSEAAILIRGETGSGKELVARAIHTISPRKGRFEAMNCATLTGEMLASELFGHVRGAFTGAYRDRPGMFRLADGGTLFLDEIAELPLDLQARVLRVLQEQRFIPLGGTDSVSVDVRIVSATHVALRDAVAARVFREDLMYRVRVIPLYLPSLHEREGDVEALAWAFIDRFNAQSPDRTVEAIADDAFRALIDYPWPGNVRELRNVVEHAFVMGDGDVLTLASLPPELQGEGPRRSRGAAPVAVPGDVPVAAPFDDRERLRIRAALDDAGGRKGEAAAALGMSRSTLWRKMRELRLG
jgi:two-component system response regulator AtoC